MPPSLTTYQQAAQSIYEPQKQAEATQITATRDITKNALESQKGQVNTDYQEAIDKLTQAVQDQTGQINQLYSQRLGGNFSGLQGNDMGQLFARTNETQGIISQTRLNKLGEITTGQTNADIAYGAGIASLAPKYQSLETQYAQSAYGSAIKDYNDQQQRAFDNKIKLAQLNMSYARLAQSGAKSASSAQSKLAAQYKVTGKVGASSINSFGQTTAGKADFSNGYAFTGPNGKPVNMAEYINGAGMGGQDVVDLLQNGSSYDRNIANKIQKSNPQNDSQLLSLLRQYDTGHYYGF